mmetsp:Transcript_35008/g.79821  ORF Transcript_35008/g.79821 Transcript_35008/m.79821 type:complete len:252 (-) Transcript_35008:1202-1957(-)
MKPSRLDPLNLQRRRKRRRNVRRGARADAAADAKLASVVVPPGKQASGGCESERVELSRMQLRNQNTTVLAEEAQGQALRQHLHLRVCLGALLVRSHRDVTLTVLDVRRFLLDQGHVDAADLTKGIVAPSPDLVPHLPLVFCLEDDEREVSACDSLHRAPVHVRGVSSTWIEAVTVYLGLQHDLQNAGRCGPRHRVKVTQLPVRVATPAVDHTVISNSNRVLYTSAQFHHNNIGQLRHQVGLVTRVLVHEG